MTTGGAWRRLDRRVTVLVWVVAFAALALAIAYVVLPENRIPPMFPGVKPLPGVHHRYLQATAALLLGLSFGLAGWLRVRLHQAAPHLSRRSSPAYPGLRCDDPV